MRQALALAAQARGRTAPNPSVGAVLVREGQVVGRGRTAPPGGPHAEVVALHEAGERARGATLYVTLEPCSHTGRTPPCAPAIAAAGVACVFAALEDPNPLVNGAGLRFLREHGIETHVGLLGAEAEMVAEPFLKRVATGLPFIEMKAALTLDGRAATASGHSRWITGEAARAWVHARRNIADAVMVGAGTARQDDPELTVRPPELDGRQPLRVVVSASGRLDPALKLFGGPLPGALVMVPPGIRAAAEARPAAEQMDRGMSWVEVPQSAEGGVDLRQALAELARRGVNDVLVEGGAGLNAALLRAGLVDRLSVFVAAKLFGGNGLPGFGELGVEDPAQAVTLRETRVSQVGDDWLFQGRPSCSGQGRG